MSNDKKTLADVQPGGRVRLGDQPTIENRARELLAAELHKDFGPASAQYVLDGNDDGCTAMRAIIAALSAQPSPASSFDLEAMLAVCVPGGDIADPQVIADNIRHWFAARQPVGQEPIGRVFYVDRILSIEWRDGMKPLEGAMLYAAPAQAVDLGPSQSVLDEVAQERARQEAKWGQQNHVDWTPTSAATDLAGAWPAGAGDHFKFITDYKAKGAEGHRLGYFDILMEEVAEAHDEARDGNAKATRAELVQVAAVAVAWIECIDRRLALTGSQAVGK
ncbi:hypothetical protein ACODUI_06220 [Stenotrophomonas geniculata]